jgi:selenocysteine lyase/cysteine desulfurase
MNLVKANDLPARSAAVGRGVDLLLASGGDERIAADPATRRNRYGTTAAPTPDEVFFSSSTASTITPRGYRAAAAAWAALARGSPGESPSELQGGVQSWFGSLRARLADLFGIAGCEVILTGSGTEAELTTLALARCMRDGPLTNIVIAPTETGSGVGRAAAGAHFLNSNAFGARCAVGARLDGWADADIEQVGVDIRDRQGRPRALAEVDEEVERRAEAALRAGRNVLLHCLETSKTGLAGLTPAAASKIQARWAGRVAVVVDCCQLRCSRAHVRRMLRLGFMVVLTGSKFFGGPPFSGALLVPAALVTGIERWAAPAGLADYSSRLDWPGALADKLGLRWSNDANLGLGLRWVAALSEMERYFAIPEALRRAALSRFEEAAGERARALERLEEAAGIVAPRPRGVLCFAMTHRDGAPFSAAETAAIQTRLRLPSIADAAQNPERRQVFHVGQPVAIGNKWALRVCASAPLISDIAEPMQTGAALEAAFAPCAGLLDGLFKKWAMLMGAA